MKLLKFVLFNFEKIQDDIAKGGGEYLGSLVVLDTPVGKRDVLCNSQLNAGDYLKAESPNEMIHLLNTHTCRRRF